MDKNTIRQLLIEQNNFLQKEETINRELFSRLKEFETTKQIIIITGIRRCGKSTLLNIIRNKNKNNYYINFDDDRFVNFSVEDFQNLYELLLELFGEKNTFFFDEIQNIPKWERFARRLFDEGKKIYITGSNASMLSRELGTHLTGRNISFSLYPFSFGEYLNYCNINVPKQLGTKDKSLIKKHFNDYFVYGGFPEFIEIKKTEYLKSVFDNILYRDIITRYNLSSEKIIKEIAIYIASNIGKELSFNKIKDLVGLSNARTIKEYFEYLENSYLIFLLPKFDYSLKKQIYANKKAYFIDSGMINLLGFRNSEDKGRILENIVFIELKRKGKEIYYHKQKKECDFITKEGLKIVEAIQVTTSLENTNTKEREIEGLLEAMKSYNLDKGLILTDDEEFELERNGLKIIVKPIWKWLLE